MSRKNIKVTPGNLDAVRRLPRHDVQATVLDEFQILDLHARGAVDEPLVQHLHETFQGDDRERTVDIVDPDARINVAARLGDLLLDALVLQLGE